MAPTSPLFGQVIFETFTTRLSDETQVELRPGGAATPVTFGNRLEYCELALHARLHESNPSPLPP